MLLKTNHYRMKKTTRNGFITNGERPRLFKLTGLLMGLVIVLSLTMANCQSKKTTTQTNNNDLTTDVPFTKEGELQFLDGKTDKLISKIDIEVAQTPEESEQGLMYRRSMADSCGMLFLFNVEEQQSFWMKNTYLPLDIIYVNANKQIVSIAQNCKPLSEESIPSNGKTKYVVEVNAGYTAKSGLKKDDKIDFTILRK